MNYKDHKAVLSLIEAVSYPRLKSQVCGGG